MNIGGAKVALVSEVLDRLLDEYGGESARRSVLFQAALQVCADESRRVKQGQPPAPLEVLVKRAKSVLDSPQGQQPGNVIGTTAAPEAPSVRDAFPPAPDAFPPPPPEKPLAPAPEREEPSLATPELFVDEGTYEDIGQPRRRLPLPILLGVLALLAVAAGTYYFYSRYEAGSSEPSPPRIAESYPPPNKTQAGSRQSGGTLVPPPETAPAAIEPTQAPEPTAVPTRALPEPVEPRALGKSARAARPPAPERWEGVQIMISPDWAERAPIYVIHFSSYREREKAQREAVQVGRRYSRPAYAAQVDLPSGVWFRVVLGDFATAEQARAFHAELAAKGTPDLGGVYRLTAP
jgi:hypothetical protein